MDLTSLKLRAASRLTVVLAALVCSACADRPGPARNTATPEARRPTPSAQRAKPPPPARAGVAWTHDTVLRRLRGHRIRVGDKAVPVLHDSIACTGIGAPAARKGGKPAWERFRCVQPTFPPDLVVGPDAVFVVEPTGSRSFVLREQRFTRY